MAHTDQEDAWDLYEFDEDVEVAQRARERRDGGQYLNGDETMIYMATTFSFLS